MKVDFWPIWYISHMTRRRGAPMTTTFEDFVADVERTSSPLERAELEAARKRFSLGARLLQHRLAAGMTPD
jgi:hypothetical protein